MSQSNDIATGESPDIVWGVAEIAKVIGKNERQTFYLVSKGLLPVQKPGDDIREADAACCAP